MKIFAKRRAKQRATSNYVYERVDDVSILSVVNETSVNHVT